MGPIPSSGTVSLPQSLEDSRIPTLPPSAYYIADFISEEEERLMLEKVYHDATSRMFPSPSNPEICEKD